MLHNFGLDWYTHLEHSDPKTDVTILLPVIVFFLKARHENVVTLQNYQVFLILYGLDLWFKILAKPMKTKILER